MLNGKEIVLGVTGGIAAYKAVELLRLLTKAGANVHVIMTRSAEEFVTFFRRWYGPTLKAFASLEGDAQDALECDLVELARRFDRLGVDAIAIPATYTEAVAVRR